MIGDVRECGYWIVNSKVEKRSALKHNTSILECGSKAASENGLLCTLPTAVWCLVLLLMLGVWHQARLRRDREELLWLDVGTDLLEPLENVQAGEVIRLLEKVRSTELVQGRPRVLVTQAIGSRQRVGSTARPGTGQLAW